MQEILKFLMRLECLLFEYSLYLILFIVYSALYSVMHMSFICVKLVVNVLLYSKQFKAMMLFQIYKSKCIDS